MKTTIKLIAVILILVIFSLSLSGCGLIEDLLEPSCVELTEKDSELIEALSEYLSNKYTEADKADRTTEDKINEIRKGEAQPLLIDVDPDSYYFVACYYNADANDEAANIYQNVSDYIWVKYKATSDIRESYNGKNLIKAFQLNKASVTRNIVTGEKRNGKFEYFQPFSAEFTDGVNTAVAETVKKTFIYLNKSESNTIYYSTKSDGNGFNTIRCIKLEDQYYIPLLTAAFFKNGDHIEYTDYIEKGYGATHYGEYIDALMEIMIMDKYVETQTLMVGVVSTNYYGLFEVGEFADTVLK